jgi:hypothetical protein
MMKKIIRIFSCCFLLICGFSHGRAFSDYIEGIDTTDANGWARDSVFLELPNLA